MTDAFERPADDVPVDQVVATGERLKLAREAKGITIEDAAARLNISAKYIKALEQSDFESLPGLPFVKGYIRSYARYLELPGDELIAAFNQEMGVAGSNQVTSINKVGSQVKLSDTPIRLSVYLFFLIVAGISIWWWQTQSGNSLADLFKVDSTVETEQAAVQSESESDEPVSQAGQLQDPTDIQARLAARQQQLEVDPQEIMSEPKPRQPEADESTAGEEPAYLSPEEIKRLTQQLEQGGDEQSETTETSTVESAGSVESAPAVVSNSSAEAEGESDSQTVVESSAIETEVVSTVAKLEATQPAVKPKGVLVMHFVSECWISIRDASDKLVFANTKRAGDSLELSLDTPANLLVGRVSAVSEVTFNDKSIDLQSNAKKDVARLVLQ